MKGLLSQYDFQAEGIVKGLSVSSVYKSAKFPFQFDYGDKDTDHSEAVSYELSKLEKLDAQCWIVAAAEKYLEDRQ